MNMEDVRRLTQDIPEPPDHYLEDLRRKYNYYSTDCMQLYKFLYRLICTQQPKLSIEFGVWMGLGSAHMASAARTYGGHVIGIDITSHEVPTNQLNKIYGNYTYMLANTNDDATVRAVKDLVGKYGSIGVIYQDSSHHYMESIREWELYSPLLDADGIWLCDDVLPIFHDPKVDPPGMSMVQYYEGLPGEKMLFPEILHKGNTIGVVLP